MKNVGFIFAISAAVTWGLVYAIDQKILTKVSPLSLLFINSAVTALITLPIVIFDAGSVKSLLNSGRENLWLIFFSIVLAALASFFILSGIKALNASTASIIEIAYPFFVVLFSYLLFGQALTWQFFLGAGFLFVGSVIIIKFS